MPGHKWSDAEVEELRRLAPTGIGSAAIARAMTEKFKGNGYSYQSVAIKALRSGISIRAARVAKAPPEKRPLTPRTVDYEGEIAALKDKIKGYERDAKLLKRRIGELQEIREAINAAVYPMRPNAMRFKRKPKSKREFSACAMVGDWHTAEVIKEDATAGWGIYNLEVQERRVKAYGEKVLSWIKTQRSGLNVPRLRVPVVGDMVSGNLHYELEVTNQVPTPLAACLAGKMLSELVSGWAPHFDVIEVDIVGEANHDRLTLKLQHKQGALNSWNVVVYYVAWALLSNHKNVKVTFHEDSPAELNLDGLNVLAMHGHQVRGWMGIPNYGMQRLRGRLAMGYMYHGKAFSTILCGHWHEGQEPAGWIVNGCLCGTSEFDRDAGRFAPPSQTSFLWHPEHGAFNLTRWNLMGA